jgi:hypothetical protein
MLAAQTALAYSPALWTFFASQPVTDSHLVDWALAAFSVDRGAYGTLS